jgi:IS30 family transposase
MRDSPRFARVKGKQPGRQPLDMKKVDAAMKLVGAGTSPVEAAMQLNLGRSTIYREMRRLGVSRSSEWEPHDCSSLSQRRMYQRLPPANSA